MSGPQFFQTGYGRRFFDHQLPELTTQLSRMATAMETLAKAIALHPPPPDVSGPPARASKRKTKSEAKEQRPMLGFPADVHAMLKPKLEGIMQERFWMIAINVRNMVIDVVEIARGSLTGVEVHPREVFRPAIAVAAAGIIVAHNHPSGDPTPSSDDILLTKRLKAVGEVVGIPVIDHMVLTEDKFRSIAEQMGSDF